MRIAYLVNQYPKPSHTFIRREILALERLGVDVFRISLRGWADPLVDEQDELEREQTRYVLKEGATHLLLAVLRIFLRRPIRLFLAIALVTRLCFDRSERPFFVHLIYVAEACQIFLWLRKANVEHLHAHFGTNSAEVAMPTHVLGGPTWSFTVHGPAEFDRRPLLNLPQKIKRCTFVTAISSYGRSQLYRCVDHQHWSKIHVVHCGLDRSFYETPTSKRPNNKRVICVGRLCEPKGQLLLIDAKKILLDQGINFDLVFAGDGEMRAELEALSARYALSDSVQFLGWISSEQVRDEILAAKALVLPSFAEGLPVVIMEAMALRRPVITTYVAGIPELVRSGKHGWLIPAGDMQALVDALRELIEAPDEVLLNMGEAARARAISRHNIDVEAEKLLKLFQYSVEQEVPIRTA